MHLYQDQFSAQNDFPFVEKASKILVIASTPRSGSHMLGHALHQTQYFGFPLEYMHGQNLDQWKKQLKVSTPLEALEAVQHRRTSPNGVFSMKLHYTHLKQFTSFDQLLNLFPKIYFILIQRRDTIAQAISLSIAKQTGVWISGQQSLGVNPEYNFSDINQCLVKLLLETSAWRYKLLTHGCNFIEVTFEDIKQNLPQTILEISKFMEIDIDLNILSGEDITKKQGNQLNIDWKNRFMAEINNQDLDLLDAYIPKDQQSLRKVVKTKLKSILAK